MVKLIDVKIGTWFTFCCEEDLQQIKNQEHLDNLIAWSTPNEDGEIEPFAPVGFWNTKKEAIKYFINSV